MWSGESLGDQKVALLDLALSFWSEIWRAGNWLTAYDTRRRNPHSLP
jgi:hypothetical protein